MRQKTARSQQPMGDGCGPGRDILDRVGDKWSMLVLFLLGEHGRRFMDLWAERHADEIERARARDDGRAPSKITLLKTS